MRFFVVFYGEVLVGVIIFNYSNWLSEGKKQLVVFCLICLVPWFIFSLNYFVKKDRQNYFCPSLLYIFYRNRETYEKFLFIW